MNDDNLAHSIRRAFSRYQMSPAATLPTEHRTPRMSEARGLRWVPRLAAPIAALAVVAAVVATTLTPAQPAFASWNAAPSNASAAVVASAEDACLTADPEHLAGLRLVGSEQRGDYTMLLYGDGGSYGLCLTGPDIEPMVLAGPGTDAVDAPGTASDGHQGLSTEPASDITFVAQPGNDAPIAQRVQAWVIGISADVARVTIEREGAQPTIATLGDGVAFAWWPAGSAAVSVTAYNAGGDELQRFTIGDTGATINEH